MKSFKLIPNLVTFASIAAIVFLTGYNDTVDALITTFTWILILAGFTHVAMIARSMSVEDLEKLEEYKALCEPLWWSVPKTLMWLGALTYVDWTVTAITYFILSIIAYGTRKVVNDKIVEFKERMGDDDKPLELT